MPGETFHNDGDLVGGNVYLSKGHSSEAPQPEAPDSSVEAGGQVFVGGNAYGPKGEVLFEGPGVVPAHLLEATTASSGVQPTNERSGASTTHEDAHRLLQERLAELNKSVLAARAINHAGVQPEAPAAPKSPYAVVGEGQRGEPTTRELEDEAMRNLFG
jgi:hypothetical protein